MVEPSVEILPLMTSNLLTVPFLRSREVVQSLPVREGLASREIICVITMMIAGTILMSLFAVRHSPSALV